MVIKAKIEPRTREIIPEPGTLSVQGDSAGTILDVTYPGDLPGVCYMYYTNAAGEADASRLTRESSTTGKSRFTWVIPEKFCKYEGTGYIAFGEVDPAGLYRWRTRALPVTVTMSTPLDVEIADDDLQIITQAIAAAEEAAAAAQVSIDAVQEAKHYAEIAEQAGLSVETEQTATGAQITITDKHGEHVITLENGEQGKQGEPGKDGADGADGKDGENGQDGKDGQNGQDGISPTVTTTQTATGAEIVITDKNGSHTVTLLNGAKGADGKDGTNGTNGKDGADGKDGKDGHTPVRGTDYWTAADKAEIVADVLAEIPVLEEVGV